jgi:multiple antibiotic resistance protein
MRSGEGVLPMHELSFQHSPTQALKLFCAIVCKTLLIYFSFRYSTAIIKVLGHTGMDVLSKIFGLITRSLDLQFIISGIKGVFPKLV